MAKKRRSTSRARRTRAARAPSSARRRTTLTLTCALSRLPAAPASVAVLVAVVAVAAVAAVVVAVVTVLAPAASVPVLPPSPLTRRTSPALALKFSLPSVSKKANFYGLPKGHVVKIQITKKACKIDDDGILISSKPLSYHIRSLN